MGNNCCTNEMHVRTKWFHEFEQQLRPLNDWKIAITGTTTGTGRIAALTCAKKGATVFMLNRPSKRANEVLAAIQQECPGADVRHIDCDLMDFASVRAGATHLVSGCGGRLDVLCNNAGIFGNPDEATVDGFNNQMQTNHLSHFLLTKELLPCLRAAAAERGEARIVNHSSKMRLPFTSVVGMGKRGEPMDASILTKGTSGNGKFSGIFGYQQSKLANVLFTFELADKLANDKVKALVCTPGLAATSVFQQHEWPWLGKSVSCVVAACVIQSPEDGTMPLLTAMAGPEVQNGQFIVPPRCLESNGPPEVRQRPLGEPTCEDPAAQRLLWEKSEEAIGEKFVI